MTPAPRKPDPPCGYTIGASTCGQPATRQLPIGFASNAQPLLLCDQHAARFLGATEVIR